MANFICETCGGKIKGIDASIETCLSCEVEQSDYDSELQKENEKSDAELEEYCTDETLRVETSAIMQTMERD